MSIHKKSRNLKGFSKSPDLIFPLFTGDFKVKSGIKTKGILIQKLNSSMISYDQFKQRLATIRRAETKGGGGSYRNIRLSGEYMLLARESCGNKERISLRDLYALYRSKQDIHRKTAEKYI